MKTLIRLASALMMTWAVSAQATEIRVMCYADGNECDVLRQIGAQFTAAHAGTTVAVDQAPYKPNLPPTSA